MSTYSEKFYYACVHGDIDNVKKLLDKGADPNLNFFKDYPLFQALISGNTDLIMLLLSLPDIDLTITNEHHQTVIHIALMKNMDDIVRYLVVEKKFDLSDINDEVMVFMDNIEMVRFLVDHGMFVTIEVIRNAITNSSDATNIFKYLLPLLDELNVSNLVMILEDIIKCDNIEALDVLYHHSPKLFVDAINNEDYVILHEYLECIDLDILKKILSIEGVDVNIVDINGDTLLHLTASDVSNNIEIIKILFNHGIDKTIKNEGGETAEDVARDKEFDTIVNLISSYVDDDIKEPECE